MGTGASKNKRSAIVSSSKQPTRLGNQAQNRRASRRESEERGYVLLPGIKKERLRHASHNTPLNIEEHQQRVLGAAPTATSTSAAGTRARDLTGMENSSPDSTSSSSSSKSVTEELDNLRTELDQVLVGHYYAINKPAAGVLRTAEIAVLERHNQLQPLPLDYQPVIGKNTRDGHRNSDWVRPVDLVKQERDLVDRMKTEEDPLEQDTKKEDKKEEIQPSSLVMYDLEDEQDRGDFDVQKFQAVNVAKEPTKEGIDIFSQSTYQKFSSTVKKQDTPATKNILPRISDIAGTSTEQNYDPSEEELLKSIEQDFI